MKFSVTVCYVQFTFTRKRKIVNREFEDDKFNGGLPDRLEGFLMVCGNRLHILFTLEEVSEIWGRM